MDSIGKFWPMRWIQRQTHWRIGEGGLIGRVNGLDMWVIIIWLLIWLVAAHSALLVVAYMFLRNGGEQASLTKSCPYVKFKGLVAKLRPQSSTCLSTDYQ